MTEPSTTRVPFPKATAILTHPVVQLLDRFVVWVVVGLLTLVVLGGKTWLTGFINESPGVRGAATKHEVSILDTRQARTEEALNEASRILHVNAIQLARLTAQVEANTRSIDLVNRRQAN